MTEFVLYREPTPLDVVQHRHLKLKRIADHSMTEGMHSCFMLAAEITHAAREFVIAFVRDMSGGEQSVMPIALLGVQGGENLYLDGTAWNAGYAPAYIRRYPFWAANVEGKEAPVLLFDAWWKGFSETEGDALYGDDGKPTPRLTEALQFIDTFETEFRNTRAFCDSLVSLDVLREMKATLSLPDGRQQALEGLFAVDETRLRALPDETVLELYRRGMLPLIYAHQMSLANMQGLIDRTAKRMAAPAS